MSPMGFVGKSRLEAAQRVLPEVVSSWRTQWCFGAEAATQVAVLAAEVPGVTSLAAMDWVHVATAEGSIWLGCREVSSWHRMVFAEQANEVPVDTVAQYLVQQAQLGLANGVLAALERPAVAELSSDAVDPPSSPFSPCVLVKTNSHGEELCMLLDASLLSAYLPMPEPRVALIDRKSVIGAARVKLRLSLPLSEISVADLSDLHPGDILKAATPLSQPFHLMTDQDALLAKGFLVRARTQLAVQLTDR